MTTPGNLSEQVLNVPSGAGGVGGLGDTFRADPHTGTGHYAVPIELPAGHNGLRPEVSLSYATGAGAGLCGVGWAFGVGAVRRRTDKGIPTFSDDDDIFVLGDDELVPLADGAFVRRAEGAFSRIRHVRTGREDYWIVTERTGLRRIYGRYPSARDGDGRRIAAWHLTEICDPHDNRVQFTYERDGNRCYLVRIDWAAGAYRALLDYAPRPDVLRTARHGPVQVTDRRLAALRVQIARQTGGALTTFETYALSYDQSPITGLSRLRAVTRTGAHVVDTSEAWPALRFDYAEPAIGPRAIPVAGHTGRSLARRELTLVDLDGSGLPDLLQSTPTSYLLRRNLGDATFGPAVPITGPSARLGEPGVFLSDMSGRGFADLVTPRGYYANEGRGFDRFFPFPYRPSVDLDDPDVRVVDLDGDGVGDVLHTRGTELLWHRNLGRGGFGPAAFVPPSGAPRLSSRWTRLADMTGDGLADLVEVSNTGLLIYENLGFGRFAPPRRLPLPTPLPAWVEPEQIQLGDVTGTGAADVIVRLGGTIAIYPNGCGAVLGAPRSISVRALGASAHLEPVDLLGTAVPGLLLTDDTGERAWTFYELWRGTKPDALVGIDNGLGATTALTYGTTAQHAARDRRAGRPWRYPLPYALLVVDTITTEDATTGTRLGQRFAYHEGYHDAEEREYRGFAIVEQIDTATDLADEATSAPSRVVRFFDVGTGHRFVERYGALIAPLPRDQLPPTRDAARALRGALVREEVYGLDAIGRSRRTFAITHHGYTVRQVVGPARPDRPTSFFVTAGESLSAHLERTTQARIVRTTSRFDRYGRLIEQRERAEGRRGTFSTAHEQQQTDDLERYTLTEYLTVDAPDAADPDAAYTPSFLVDLPSRVRAFGVTGTGDVLLSEQRTFYDGDAYEGLGYPGSATSPSATRGWPSCTLERAFHLDDLDAAFPSGAGATAALTDRGGYLIDDDVAWVHAARTAHDARGMTTGALSARGAETTVTYDGIFGLFPIRVVDGADHPTDLVRAELPHLVARTLDPNGNRTTFAYDARGLPAAICVQGKLVMGDWQGDPETHPTQTFSYDLNTLPAKITTATRQVRLGATHTVVAYVDGLGRTIQERHQAEPNPASPSTPRWRVTGAQVFDHKGLLIRAYQPTFAASSDYAPGDEGTAFVQTFYDPLGRPIQITHPDGTFERTTYHPWVQQAFDRNDTAEGLTSEDARYGDWLDRFEGHLDTPTTTWVDALGRPIAVGEDNGVAAGADPEKAIRVTTYEVHPGLFTGTTLVLTLDHDLSENYFALVLGAVDATNSRLDNAAVRVTADPFATGDLADSGAPNALTLTRGSASEADWQGTVIVVECLSDPDGAGFRLRDARSVTLGATSTTGAEQTVTVSTNTRWKQLNQVAVYGGLRGGGVSTGSAGPAHASAVCARLVPSGDDQLLVGRWAVSALPEASFLAYVVEWGAQHHLERVEVIGDAGAAGASSTAAFDTAALATSVPSGATWLTHSGWAKTDDVGGGFPGALVALGDGVTVPGTANTVAVGAEQSVERRVVVTVHHHPALAVDWRRQGSGYSTATTAAVTVDAPAEGETYDASGNPKTTEGRRLSLASTSSGSSSADAAQAHVTARSTASTTVTLRRAADGASLSAWVQAVDLAGLTYSPHAVHVTRSVLDLRDQAIAVWDARGLSAPTWTFAHDALGRPLAAVHSTGLGPRYTLADAAGNPMWSRDARGIEVDRTFDALERPLTEHSDDGTGAVLRRMWRYIAYDELDADFGTHQGRNVFGAVEEARDADGLRVFTYDFRGLPVEVSHRFWPQRDGAAKPWNDATSALWSSGSSWAPALPDAARSTLTDWLELDGLTASTQVIVQATYDAAGRPARMDYPEGMATRLSYDEGGRLSRVEVDRGAGGGFFDALASVDYDARGKATKLVFGNGVQTTREHDEALERLTRLYTKLPGTPDVEHQDLRYAYDPAGHVLNIEDALSESSLKDNKLIPNSRGFTYDARYRLIRATGRKHNTVFDRSTGVLVPSPDENDYVPYDLRYAYDEVGNFRINQEYASSGKAHLNYKAGRIDLFNGRNAEADDARPDHGNFRYDANGSVTHTPRQQELGYAFDGQPVYVDMGGGGKVRYFRHADQRVVRMVNKPGVMAMGVYLGPWEYHSRQGTVSFEKVVLHVHGEGKVAQVERVLDGTDPDSLAVFYVHEDHLGSGHVLTDGDGELLSQEEYFAYGRSSDRRDARNRYRWIGVERDEDTGLCLTGPRLYDPVVCRFGSGDPVVKPGRSPFEYSSSSPLSRSDPEGYDDSPPMPVADKPTARVTRQDRKVIQGRMRESELPETVTIPRSWAEGLRNAAERADADPALRARMNPGESPETGGMLTGGLRGPRNRPAPNSATLPDGSFNPAADKPHRLIPSLTGPNLPYHTHPTDGGPQGSHSVPDASGTMILPGIPVLGGRVRSSAVQVGEHTYILSHTRESRQAVKEFFGELRQELTRMERRALRKEYGTGPLTGLALRMRWMSEMEVAFYGSAAGGDAFVQEYVGRFHMAMWYGQGQTLQRISAETFSTQRHY